MKVAAMNPTLTLMACVWLAFSGVLVVAVVNAQNALVLAACFMVNAVLGILTFTPLHEASHYIASDDRRINEAVMWLCWPVLLHSPFLFRTLHFRHHARVGQANDPDAFTQRATQLGRWGASFLIVANYYRCYLREAQSPRELAHMVFSLAALALAVAFALSSPWTSPLLAAWLLPNLVTVGILGYLNTAWPHSEVEGVGPLEGTRNLTVPRWLEHLMGYQNYHQVHHLRPTTPWYRYPAVWAQQQAEQAQDVPKADEAQAKST